MTDQEELELLELEKEKAMVTSEKRSPMFSSVAEANAAMKEANFQRNRAAIAASGVNPYVDALMKSGQQASSLAVGGGVGYKLSQLAGQGILKQALAGAAGGATSGALQPALSTGEQLSNTAKGGVFGAALGGGLQLAGKGIQSFGQILRKLPSRLNDKKGAEFANKVSQAFINTKSKAVKKFGSGLDELTIKDPNKKVNLFENNNIQNIVTDPDLTAEAASVFKKTPILRDIIEGSRSPEITAKEAQDIVNYLQFKVPQSIKSQHLDIIDMINEVKLSQANAFPKEMASLRSEYARIAEPFKSLKSKMKLESVLNSIDAGFGGAVQRTQLKELFKDNPELLKEIGGYKAAGNLLKGLKEGSKKAAGLAAIGIGGKMVYDTVKNK